MELLMSTAEDEDEEEDEVGTVVEDVVADDGWRLGRA